MLCLGELSAAERKGSGTGYLIIGSINILLKSVRYDKNLDLKRVGVSYWHGACKTLDITSYVHLVGTSPELKGKAMFRRLLVALSLVVCIVPTSFAQQMPLRIGYQTGEINVLLTYAINSGLFEKHKLDVKLVSFPAGPAMLPALASKEIDLAWMGEFPSVTGYANGMPIEILMMERLDFTNIRLAANPNSGASNVAGLKGKKVGASVGSSSHYHLLRALSQAGMKQSDITLVNLAPANMPAAYMAEHIDAALTWEPNIGLIEKAGAKTLATTKSLGMITGGVWVGQKDLSAKTPDTLHAFMKAWRQAQRDHAANPKQVRQFEAKRVGQTPEEFDALIARQTATHPTFEELLTADFMGAPGKETESRLMKHLQGIGEFLLSEQRIKEAPKNWAGLFNTAPIRRVLESEKK